MSVDLEYTYEEEAYAEKGQGKVVEGPHYITRWQLWDRDDNKWDPFDPDELPREEPKLYPSSRFTVNVRHKSPYDEPEFMLSDFSPPLLGFLRAIVGDEFFDDEPLYPVKWLFSQLANIRQKQARAKELLVSKGYIDYAGKAEEVEGLGYVDATKSTTTWAKCRSYLTDLVEHLEPFVAYIDERYAPIEAKLARMREYGQFEFNMLQYHFEPGMKLVEYSTGRPDAFVLKHRSLETSYNGPVLRLRGHAYHFNGDRYEERSVGVDIDLYKGTRRVEALPVAILSPELEESLKKRGETYITMAGVYHKDYQGKRVILDPKAYRNRDGYVRNAKTVIKPVEEENLYLLPPDIEGFNLANKVCQECQRLGYYCKDGNCQVWQKFDVTKVNDVVFDEKAWDHLVLEAKTKRLIKALVRATTNKNTSNTIISDVISGKGGGLLSVLHGPPGTGKTLTAESIAEHLHRPLYMVGFSELSITPTTLEPTLQKILKLATAWDAVLLIDEADVFLEQRSLHELERNALVSVALRLLEYHRGVLFLTTNRISSFDEAFLSRFSIAIKYRELDRAGRYAVWRKFFEMAGCRIEGSEDEFTKIDQSIISSEDLDELAEKPFNGRTIKNLVRTAQALALSEGETLSVEHVKTVVEVQENFLDEFALTK